MFCRADSACLAEAAGAGAAHVGMFNLTEKEEKKFYVYKFLHTIIFFHCANSANPFKPCSCILSIIN